MNAYIQDHAGDSHPIELKVAGLKPSPWNVADLVTLVHFIHYTHSTNFKAEIVGQKLIDKLGQAQAREIMPLTVNPDWGTKRGRQRAPPRRRVTSVASGWAWNGRTCRWHRKR
jgi:acyl-homoserine lactone acylase PvdQ